MIVICEACGKKHRIDPAKIKGRAASSKCRSCAHRIVVPKAPSSPSGPATPKLASEPRATPESIAATVDDGATTAISEAGALRPKTWAPETQRPRRAGRFGLQAKMLVLFLFIPMIFMAGASLFYTWQDQDEKFHDKFMGCTPIAGTRFVIAATTYMDEFTGPVRMIESNARIFIGQAKMVILAMLGAIFLLIGLVVSIYGHRLTGKIRSLTAAADRIGGGELGMEIDTKSKDEIGDLAEAIAKMQDSRVSGVREPRC